jgi:phosphocarrier protein
MSERIERTAQIVNQRGLHARASAAFVREALRHNAKISVTYDGQTVNASSIMDLLMLQAPCGQWIDIVAEGEEAEHAMGQLLDLIARKFDEEEFGDRRK